MPAALARGCSLFARPAVHFHRVVFSSRVEPPQVIDLTTSTAKRCGKFKSPVGAMLLGAGR